MHLREQAAKTATLDAIFALFVYCTLSLKRFETTGTRFDVLPDQSTESNVPAMLMPPVASSLLMLQVSTTSDWTALDEQVSSDTVRTGLNTLSPTLIHSP